MDTERKIVFGSRCGGVGDNLVLTPLMKYFKNCTLELLDHPKSRNVAPLFDGLCSINFVNEPVGINESRHPHVAQKKIEGYGIQNLVNCVPQIKLYNYEIQEAQKDLSGIKNPVVFVANNNGSNNRSDVAARYRIPSDETSQGVIDKLAEEHSVLQFGLSTNFSKFNKTIEVLDLPIRKLAAYYSVIGKYSGVDTGDYHLMLSVGGFCNVLCPRDSGFYRHDTWHYTRDLWAGEPCRVSYNIFL